MKTKSFLIAALLAGAASMSSLSAQPGWTKYPTPPLHAAKASAEHGCCHTHFTVPSSERKGAAVRKEHSCDMAGPSHRAGKHCPMDHAAKS